MDVEVIVMGQKISFHSNAANIVSGSNNFVRFVFNFSKDWGLLTKYAQFTQDDNTYSVVISSDNSCYLPREVYGGNCTVVLHGIGVTNGGVIATTNTLKFDVIKSDYVYDGSSEVVDDDYIATVEELTDYINQQ